MRVVLGHRTVRRLWLAQAFSELGDWSTQLALGILVWNRTENAIATAAVILARALPWIGIGQVVSSLGDRFARRSVMIGADVGRAAIFLLMLLHPPIWLILVMATVAASMTPAFESSRAATMPTLVDEAEYPAVVSLTNVTSQTALAFGYAVGGWLVAIVGTNGALVVNAASFAVSAAILLITEIPAEPAREGPKVRIRDGAAIAFGDRYISHSLWMVSITAMGAMTAEATVVIYAQDYLGKGDVATGVLATAVPLGTIIATALIPFRGSHRHLLRMAGALGAASAGAAALLFMLAPELPFVFLGYFAVGVIFAIGVPSNIVTGLRTPNAVRASTFGVITGVLYGSEGIGAALGGVLAHTLGVRESIVLCLSIAATVSWLGFMFTPGEHSRRRRYRRRASAS